MSGRVTQTQHLKSCCLIALFTRCRPNVIPIQPQRTPGSTPAGCSNDHQQIGTKVSTEWSVLLK